MIINLFLGVKEILDRIRNSFMWEKYYTKMLNKIKIKFNKKKSYLG